MEEVSPNNLQVGQDYYIQMVGRFARSARHQSGKAIGKGFIRTLTFREVEEQQGYDATAWPGGLHPDCIHPLDIFVQFREVVPVNPGGRPCGICNYQFYPAAGDHWDTMTDPTGQFTTEELQRLRCGGYKFFKMNKKEIEKRVAERAMKQGVEQVAPVTAVPGVKTHMTSFMGGKKRRRRRRKTRRKSRKMRKKRTKKSRRKKRTKRRR